MVTRAADQRSKLRQPGEKVMDVLMEGSVEEHPPHLKLWIARYQSWCAIAMRANPEIVDGGFEN